jgi:diguanylate cyclase (GGDEF)-like protein
LIDSVARTTSHRDRDSLDAAIATMLFEHLEPERVTVYRLIGQADDTRVQRRVSISAESGRLGPESVDLKNLPRVNDRAHWRECVMMRDAVHFVPPDRDICTDRLCSVFPLVGERDAIGLVEIEFASSQRWALKPHEARLVKGVLGILNNHLQALDYGERDTLTGLLNRRTFDCYFAKLRERAQEQERSGDEAAASWLAVIDIDLFKSINDSHGHLFGDEVLLLLSRLMHANFRSVDPMFRFGGEEFVIAIDGADEAGARAAFERFRARVEQFRFPQVGTVTVSIGFTRIRAGDAPQSAVERADAALYFAKHNGRNQSLSYESLVESGRMASKEERSEVELF